MTTCLNFFKSSKKSSRYSSMWSNDANFNPKTIASTQSTSTSSESLGKAGITDVRTPKAVPASTLILLNQTSNSFFTTAY